MSSTCLQNCLIPPHSGRLWANWLHLGNLKIGHSGSVYKTGNDKCYRWGLSFRVIAQHLSAHHCLIPANSGYRFSTFYINLHLFPQFLSLKNSSSDEKRLMQTTHVQHKFAQNANKPDKPQAVCPCMSRYMQGRWYISLASLAACLELVLLGCLHWAAVLLAVASWVRAEGGDGRWAVLRLIFLTSHHRRLWLWMRSFMKDFIAFQVFPPSFRELSPPPLELFDLDETFSSEKARLAQITNKCECGQILVCFLLWVLLNCEFLRFALKESLEFV